MIHHLVAITVVDHDEGAVLTYLHGSFPTLMLAHDFIVKKVRDYGIKVNDWHELEDCNEKTLFNVLNFEFVTKDGDGAEMQIIPLANDLPPQQLAVFGSGD